MSGQALEALEPHLAAGRQEADALVDLSNVVRDTRIGERGAARPPRSLHRLRLVVEALARHTSDSAVTVYAIADRSLPRAPHEYADPAEPRLLRRWIERGLVEEAPDADDPLLELADVTGLPVISNDDFDDFRTAHPWIQGNTTQFLGVVPILGGTAVALRPRAMGVRTPAQISRKLEESDLKAHGLLQGRARKPITAVVKRYWSCPHRGCQLYDRARGGAVRLPLLRGGTPLCELHRVPLVDDGPRTGIAQLKLHVRGECVRRFTLDVGTRVTLGRAPEPEGIALHGLVPVPLLRRISRGHLEVTVEENGLLLRDLGRGGTRLLRHGTAEWRPLNVEEPTHFNLGDVAELTPGVTVTRSGRRYPPEIAAAWRRSAAGRAPSAALSAETELPQGGAGE
ncbi:FHA domain-containing protein [Streptomyces radicis]|uniref:FHA domain-containing protein n=1 Tax=Streptomyces radicis TaxID=1750517 RepID=A0A3A9WI23_9ACTN|nr:FHA domain-containing protein [Streptomyces radicis]RKN11963.1 FHA domain-containing protein [Streptomyces radicis]RKN25986.1 FHA domain-containing protein [Streptomyces radicis]